MATTVIMPKLGLTMTEGTIEKWLKEEGDRVEKGEPLVEILTEKINFQYESPASGILRRILHREGEVVPVAAPIAVIADEEEILPEIEAQVSERVVETQGTRPPPSPAKAEEIPKRVFASPIARKIAREKGIDLASLKGSGPGGRIIKADVVEAVERIAKEERKPSIAPPAPAEKRIPLKGIRKVIAGRMTESFRDIPHFYLAREVEMAALQAVREKLREEAEKRSKVRLTLTDLLVKVVATVLRQHPLMNSRIEGADICLLDEINIGVAIALDEGLIVPVLREADRKSVIEISTTLRDLTERARQGKLSLEDVGGGTFTLSNMGMLGIDKFNAIINPPECSILAVGRTVEKPVVKAGEIVIRPMTWLTLSADHRIVDGATAALFLNDIVRTIENPEFLLL